MRLDIFERPGYRFPPITYDPLPITWVLQFLLTFQARNGKKTKSCWRLDFEKEQIGNKASKAVRGPKVKKLPR